MIVSSRDSPRNNTNKKCEFERKKKHDTADTNMSDYRILSVAGEGYRAIFLPRLTGAASFGTWEDAEVHVRSEDIPESLASRCWLATFKLSRSHSKLDRCGGLAEHVSPTCLFDWSIGRRVAGTRSHGPRQGSRVGNDELRTKDT